MAVILVLLCRERFQPHSISLMDQSQGPTLSATTSKRILTPVWKQGGSHDRMPQPLPLPSLWSPAGGDRGEQTVDKGDSYLSPPLSPINLTVSQMNLFAADSQCDYFGSSVGGLATSDTCSSGPPELTVPADDKLVDGGKELMDHNHTLGMEKRCDEGQATGNMTTDASPEHGSTSTPLAVRRLGTIDSVGTGFDCTLVNTPGSGVRQGSTGTQESRMGCGPIAFLDTAGKDRLSGRPDGVTSETQHAGFRPSSTSALDSTLRQSSIDADVDMSSLVDRMRHGPTDALNRAVTGSHGELITSLTCTEVPEECLVGECSAGMEGNKRTGTGRIAHLATDASVGTKGDPITDGAAMRKHRVDKPLVSQRLKIISY